MALVIVAIVPLAAQQTAAPADRVQGSVTAVDAQAKQIAVKTDKGEPVGVSTTDRTAILRMPAGVTDAKQAVKIQFSDIAAGDIIIALGKLSADKKSLEGAKIYIRTKSDIAEIHKQEDEDWQKRGTSGVVSAIDAAAKTVTLKVGQKEIKVQPSDKTDYRRYSLDSFRSTDAKPSSFAEIKTGDQVRVLGNKNAEGDTVTAERIFFGTFRQIAGTIETIDPQTNEIKVKEAGTKKSLVVVKLDPDSQMKKLETMTANQLARRYNPTLAQGDDSGATGGRGAAAGGRGSGGRGNGGRGGDFGSILERSPAVTLAGLKQGDAVMLLTTAGSDPNRVTAVILLAGVEPILTSATATRDIMAGWSLGGGGGGGEGN